MRANEIYFTEEKYGYDKAQVDSYIRMLTQEYQALQRENEMAQWIIEDAKKAAEEIDSLMVRLRLGVAPA